MTNFEKFKKKMLLNPNVLKEYEAHQAEFDLARSLIKTRLEVNMTQAEVSS